MLAEAKVQDNILQIDSTAKYTCLASSEQIERTMIALKANNIHALVAENRADALQILKGMLPANAEIFLSISVTLSELGITDEIDHSGMYNSVRAKMSKMDHIGQNRKMEKMAMTPEVVIGSVNALIEDGSVIIASMTGNQLAGYAAGAAKVIWVVGTQKIVPTLEEGMERVYHYCLPMEEAHSLKTYNMRSSINKILIVHREYTPGRTTIILVKENIGY